MPKTISAGLYARLYASVERYEALCQLPGLGSGSMPRVSLDSYLLSTISMSQRSSTTDLTKLSLQLRDTTLLDARKINKYKHAIHLPLKM